MRAAPTLSLLLAAGACASHQTFSRAVDIEYPLAYARDGLVVHLTALAETRFGIQRLQGVVTNKTGRALGSCAVTVRCLDESGVPVALAHATSGALRKGEEWRFDVALEGEPTDRAITRIEWGEIQAR